MNPIISTPLPPEGATSRSDVCWKICNPRMGLNLFVFMAQVLESQCISYTWYSRNMYNSTYHSCYYINCEEQEAKLMRRKLKRLSDEGSLHSLDILVAIVFMRLAYLKVFL